MSLPPPPSVPFFPAGHEAKRSDFTTWWFNNAAFVQSRIVFRGRQNTTTTTLVAGAVTTIGIDTVDEDPFSGWSSGTFAWGPPVGYSGWYQVTVTLFTATLAAGCDIRPGLGGTYSQHLATVQAPTSHAAGAEGTDTVYLIGGLDTVTATGAILNTALSFSTSNTFWQQSSMEIMWLSP